MTKYIIEEQKGKESGVNEHTIKYWLENGVEIDEVLDTEVIEEFEKKEALLEKIKTYTSEVCVTKTQRGAEAEITIYKAYEYTIYEDGEEEYTELGDAPLVRIWGNALKEDVIHYSAEYISEIWKA